MKKPKRARRLSKTKKKIAMKQAGKNPNYINHVAGSLHWNKPKSDRLGAASPVRHIMKDGQLIQTEEKQNG